MEHRKIDAVVHPLQRDVGEGEPEKRLVVVRHADDPEQIAPGIRRTAGLIDQVTIGRRPCAAEGEVGVLVEDDGPDAGVRHELVGPRFGKDEDVVAGVECDVGARHDPGLRREPAGHRCTSGADDLRIESGAIERCRELMDLLDTTRSAGSDGACEVDRHRRSAFHGRCEWFVTLRSCPGSGAVPIDPGVARFGPCRSWEPVHRVEPRCRQSFW